MAIREWPTDLLPCRPGEELPLAKLSPYLQQQSHLEPYGFFPWSPLEVRQFPHGHSNWTYLLRNASHAWVLRRPPAGQLAPSAHDMGREYRVLLPLSQVFPSAPRPLHFCEDPSILGAPFYLMEYRQGRIYRGQDLHASQLHPSELKALCTSLIHQLATLHQLDLARSKLDHLGKPQGYTQRQIEGWIQRFTQAEWEPLHDLRFVAQWLRDHLPTQTPTTFVHNDYKFDNILFDPQGSSILAILDWEMATLGNPWMDLGTTLAYWTEPGEEDLLGPSISGPTSLPGALRREELVALYEQFSHQSVVHWEYYWLFGLFKVATIIAQIYARYLHKSTLDPRFASFDQRVKQLGAFARKQV